jgi:hypothetical protein
VKYLKTYKIFETINPGLTNEVWNDISDILIELEDLGFSITKDWFEVKKVGDKLCDDVIEIIIDSTRPKGRYFTKTRFSFTEVEDYIRRLIDYMTLLDWNWSLFYLSTYKWVEFETGGSHLLIKKPKFGTPAEESLYKSLVNSTLQSVPVVKLTLYKDIDHLISSNH